MEDKQDDFDVDLSSGARLLAELPSSLSLDMVAECVPVCSASGDDEDGGHLSGVCREEELPIEAGIEAGVDVLSNRRYNQP